jgi:hypothetical protein
LAQKRPVDYNGLLFLRAGMPEYRHELLTDAIADFDRLHLEVNCNIRRVISRVTCCAPEIQFRVVLQRLPLSQAAWGTFCTWRVIKIRKRCDTQCENTLDCLKMKKGIQPARRNVQR